MYLVNNRVFEGTPKGKQMAKDYAKQLAQHNSAFYIVLEIKE